MSLIVDNLRHQVLGPVSLTVEAGECVAVTGASGAGKSLLLRAIADLDPCEGHVTLGGRNWRSIRGPAWRRRVAYLPAEPGWWDDHVAPHFTDRDKAADLVERLLLPRAVMDWEIARLSTGERQRLGLVRCLLGGPEILLLDEPTAALDPDAKEAVETLLQEQLTTGTGILLVTHDADQADRLATRRYQMEKGRLQPLAEAADD